MKIDKEIIQEIDDIKKKLIKEKKKISDINNLIEEDIDKIHHIDFYSLSPKEINYKMDLTFNDLSNTHIPKPDLSSLSSHRKMTGRIIVFLKKTFFRILSPYSNFILENQRKFNKHLLEFNLLTLKKLKNIESEQNSLSKRIADNEDTLTLISEKIMDQIEKYNQ